VTHKLLLADDSVTIQRVVELTFSGEDVQVITVGDGEQAIARIPVERPDIVLADIGMPKRSGYDVAAFVKGRADLSHIPVLLLAGAFEPVDDVRAQQVKCDGVLVKPFEPQQVVARVRELVEGVKDRATAAFAPELPEQAAPPPPPPPPPSSRVERFATAETGRKESKLDDYFQGLDAALAVLDNKVDSRPPMTANLEDFRSSDVPTLEKLLGSTPLRETAGSAADVSYAPPIGPSMMDAISGHTRNAEPAPPSPPADGGNVILDAFHALLAMEQGEPRPTTARTHVSPTAPVTVTDELVDEVTRRVLERLAPTAARDLVKQVVGEVAERLIREEIARIKAAANTKR
jgi:DNA-binding response OmpR family regulator